ncbi:DUF5592 family protein [Siminovitchia fortis]|uniref:DUF5592 family protein n=1 Tax=Siminovitchia fortis TaxID=254758 RepID=UPI001FD5D8C3|nr:DUF5592 family protein [Siminovitchia fortis]
MGNYEIPKEIKSKPKLMGLEMKELVILLIGFFSIFTFLKDMVHTVLAIPFMVIATGLLLWLVMPSSNNPTLRNYMSIILFFKRDKQTYHALDHDRKNNEKLIQLNRENNRKGEV